MFLGPQPAPKARLAALLLVWAAVAGCVTPIGSDPIEEGRPVPPRYRGSGERLPPYSGRNPAERGWVKVDDLLWIDTTEVDAYEQGLVFDGSEYVPFAQSLPADVSARDGYRIRTDHVAISTNCSWSKAVEASRAAESHVMRLMLAYDDRLDLRLPHDPLPVVVTDTRAEFERILYGIVSDPVSWGAFYDAAEGVVYVSMEPAPAGALPWIADLRHEMTHQVLDLSRRQSLRGRPFPEGWFWLWEGIAIHSEMLGDPEGTNSSALRVERFEKRMAWKQWTPLATLVRLGQERFEGRHYDQTAVFMRYLLDEAKPQRRRAVLDLVGRLQRGPLAESALESALRKKLPDVEQDWLQSLAR